MVEDYDPTTVSHKALEIQMAIQDILKDDEDMHELVDDRIYIDDIRSDGEYMADDEDGVLLAHDDYPAITIIYSGRAKGKIKASGYKDIGFNFVVRVHSEETQSNKGKQEVRSISELVITLLNNNYRLNGTVWDSDWDDRKGNLEYGSAVSKQDNITIFERLGDVNGIAYGLVPMDYS
jgi:hypothetical protein